MVTFKFDKSKWVRPEVYVLIGAVCTGACLAFYIGTRHLISNPDVQLSKRKRQLGIADEDDMAAIEREKKYQDSSIFRMLSKLSPKRTDAIPYPGRHDETESDKTRLNYPGPQD